MRVGTICYATDQGISHLAKDFYDAGVVTDVAVYMHGSRPTHLEWYQNPVVLHSRPFLQPELIEMIKQMDVMFFFETPFDWKVLNVCRECGTRTVIMPMYECTPRTIPVMPDKWVCPSRLDCEYFPNQPYLPVPVKGDWKLRSKAIRFLHNGGNLGLRGHKGTLEILRAMQYVKSDLELTIRAQDTSGLRKLIDAVPSVKNDARISFEWGTIDRAKLFDGYDVFLMAEKYNGLSLPLAEARAAGMMVMTSNRFPMNTWLPIEPLIPVTSYSRQCISGAYMEYDEALVEPMSIALKMDEYYGQDIADYSRSAIPWAHDNSWEVLKEKYLEVLS